MLDLAFRDIRFPRLGRMQGGFNPMVFGGQVLWYDPSDRSTLFQDRAGTVPVTEPGQLVGFQRDKGPGGFHKTALNDAARGTLARHPASGIRNLFRNSRFAGFAPQVLPSNARFATSEGVSVSASSASGTPDVSIVAINSDGSMDVRVYGSNTAAQTMFVNVSDDTPVPAVPGMSRLISADVQVISNVGPNAPTVALFSHWRDASNLQLIGGAEHIAPTAQMTRYNSPVSVAPTGTVVLRNKGLYIRVNSGDTVDYTLRVRNIQVEFGAEHTLYQATRRFGLDVEEAGGRDVWCIVADGINTGYVTPVVTPGTDKAQVFTAIRKLSDAGRGEVVGISTTLGRFNLEAPTTLVASPNYALSGGGSVINTASAINAGYAAPETVVLSGFVDIAGDALSLSRNGVGIANVRPELGTGNFSDSALNFYRRGGTQFPFNGLSYGEIIRFGAALSADQIIQTERWLAGKCGVAL